MKQGAGILAGRNGSVLVLLEARKIGQPFLKD